MKDSLKSTGRRLLVPMVKLLIFIGIHPLAVTLAGLPLSLGAGWLFASGRFRLGGVLLALVGLCDSLDGELSRRTGKASLLGALIDSTVDRLSEAIILVGIGWHFVAVRPAVTLLAAVALTGSFLVSYVRARAEGLGWQCSIGWFERPVRVAVLLAGALVGQPWSIILALWAVTVGSLITVVQRLAITVRQSRQS